MYSVKCSELGELLDSLPPNDTSSPYEIEVSSVSDKRELGYILIAHPQRYVSISFKETLSLISAEEMFSDCKTLISIDASKFENIQTAEDMFWGCENLVSVTNSNFGNLTEAATMFFGCKSLRFVDTSSFSSLRIADGMFELCLALETIDTSSFLNVQSANGMFYRCESLTVIDAGPFRDATSCGLMFAGCTNLNTIDNWNFDTGLAYFEYDKMLYGTSLGIVRVPVGETYNGNSFYAGKGTEVRDWVKSTQGLDVTVELSLTHNPTKVPYRLLEDFMSNMPENTVDTPYGVELTDATRYDLIKQKLEDNPRIGKILAKHSTPYISLSFGDDVVPVVKALPYTNGMLKDAQCLVSIDTSNFESATEVPSMFKGCVHLKSVDMAGFKRADNGLGMFANCYALESVDFQGGTTISFAMEMFAGCGSLKEVDCSAFGSVNNAENMFANCVSLTDIGDADFSSLTNSSYMFHGCSALTEIDCSSFTELTEATEMFGGCANLETVHGWSVDYENCNVEGMFSECPSLRAVYVRVPEPEPPREGEWNVWSVKKDAVDVFDSSGGKSQIPLTTVDGETVVAEGKTDELIFSDDAAVTDEDILRMIRTRIELTSDQSSLDPAEDNFVVWAKEGSNVMTNIADVGIQMADNDFDDIFGGEE